MLWLVTVCPFIQAQGPVRCVSCVSSVSVSYITKCLYLPISLIIQLRSLWNLKLKLLGYQSIVPTCLIQVGYTRMATIRHEVVQIIQKIYLSLPNHLGYLWNFKLKLLGYRPILPSCLIQMAIIGHGVVQIIKKDLYLCQVNSNLDETLNLRQREGKSGFRNGKEIF